MHTCRFLDTGAVNIFPSLSCLLFSQWYVLISRGLNVVKFSLPDVLVISVGVLPGRPLLSRHHCTSSLPLSSKPLQDLACGDVLRPPSQ